MKKYFLILLLFAFSQTIFANNIQVEDVKYDKNTKKVSFKISWQNSWRQTSDFHDAAWVFCKYRTVNTGRWLHTDIKANSSKTTGALETKETADKLGFFVRFKTDSTGHIKPTEVSFEVENIIGVFPDFQVFAIEMVYVPEGAFYAGAPEGYDDVGFGDFDAFHQKSFLTNFTEREPLKISSEDKLMSTQYKKIVIGLDSNASIPADFPKGYASFYCMKHEINNDQLIKFFNNAGFAWVSEFGFMRINELQYRYLNRLGALNYTKDTFKIVGDITSEGMVFSGDSKYQLYPAMMTPLTLTNYLGWAGLAPMTELQFEKACRGPLYPVRDEIAAGISRHESTTVYDDTSFSNLYTDKEALKKHYSAPWTFRLKRCGYAADSTTSRITSNATFYGILNMSDNITEITVSLLVIDTNKYFNGNSYKTEKFIKGSTLGFNAYKLRPMGEDFSEDVVIYNRGFEGISYKYFNLQNISNNTDKIGVMEKIAGGRGVRKPD